MEKSMKKSIVTEFFLEYFEKHRINKAWISEKTGIDITKISEEYRQELTASEFLELCAFLQIEPELVLEYSKKHFNE